MKMRFFDGSIRASKKDGDTLTIEGFGNVESVDGEPSIDTYGTVFEVDGFDLSRMEKRGFLPMLLNHDRNKPIGKWTKAESREVDGVKGLWMTGEVFGETEPQREAQTLIRQGAASDLSIGFVPLEVAFVQGDGKDYAKIRARLMETSVVTIGSNDDSSISLIRALHEGRDDTCPVCMGGPAVLRRLSSADVALRAAEAHARELLAGDDPVAVRAMAERLLALGASLRGEAPEAETEHETPQPPAEPERAELEDDDEKLAAQVAEQAAAAAIEKVLGEQGAA